MSDGDLWNDKDMFWPERERGKFSYHWEDIASDFGKYSGEGQNVNEMTGQVWYHLIVSGDKKLWEDKG